MEPHNGGCERDTHGENNGTVLALPSLFTALHQLYTALLKGLETLVRARAVRARARRVLK